MKSRIGKWLLSVDIDLVKLCGDPEDLDVLVLKDLSL